MSDRCTLGRGSPRATSAALCNWRLSPHCASSSLLPAIRTWRERGGWASCMRLIQGCAGLRQRKGPAGFAKATRPRRPSVGFRYAGLSFTPLLERGFAHPLLSVPVSTARGMRARLADAGCTCGRQLARAESVMPNVVASPESGAPVQGALEMSRARPLSFFIGDRSRLSLESRVGDQVSAS